MSTGDPGAMAESHDSELDLVQGIESSDDSEGSDDDSELLFLSSLRRSSSLPCVFSSVFAPCAELMRAATSDSHAVPLQLEK